MRIVFSRKGFDSAAGKAPSPIIDGEPVSLPIPTQRRSETSYSVLGLGDVVEHVTKGRIHADHLCHDDPAFFNGRWAFGQTGAAQTHLERNGVDVGDVFLFFGLFANLDGRDPYHLIFGYMKVDEVRALGSQPLESDSPKDFPRRHPHTIGEWNENNTLYLGSGGKAKRADPCLRLTKCDASASIWSVPSWLKTSGLTYHSNPLRWARDGELHVVARGQEFVSNVEDQQAPKLWLRAVQSVIETTGVETRT